MKKSLAAFVFMLLPAHLLADATIIIDGEPSDWPADAFYFLDAPDDMPPPFADILRLMITNDNSSGSNGYLYLGVVLQDSFRENVGRKDIDVYVYLDVNRDGDVYDAEDRIIEITGDRLIRPPTLGAVWDGRGNWLADVPRTDWAYRDNFIEARVPYTALGLSHGADSFGVAFSTDGHPNVIERAPERGQGQNGFIIYPGGDAEPLAVKMIGFSATADNQGVSLFWATGSERENAGFLVYRRRADGKIERVNPRLIPGQLDSALGENYYFFDPAGKAGDEYFIEDIETSGWRARHGPVTAGYETTPQPKLRQKPGRQNQPAGQEVIRHELPWKLAIEQPGLYFLETDAGPGLALSLRRRQGPVAALAAKTGYFFIGRPERDRYADYEVVVASVGPARRMPRRQVLACDQPQHSLPWRLELEQDQVYFVASPGEDPFFWTVAFSGAPAEISFSLPDPAQGDMVISVEVAGAGDGPHRALVFLNDSLQGEFLWRGRELEVLTFKYSGGLDEAKPVSLHLETAEEHDVFFVDRVVVDYRRKLRAGQGQLSFQAPPGTCLKISGVAGDELLFDTSLPHQPRLLFGYRLEKEADGSLSLVFRDSGKDITSERTYLLASPRHAARPRLLGTFRPLNFFDPALPASAVIIAPADFLVAAERLCAFHRFAGTGCLPLDVASIYDSFSFGRPGARPIKDFLDGALSFWRLKPEHVLLLGGASVDSRGRLDSRNRDLVPAPFIKTRRGWEAVSDGWYAGKPPRLAVGRLAVETAAQAHGVVEKIISHHSQPPLGRVLLVADRTTSGVDFGARAKALAQACVPAGHDARILFAGEEQNPALRLAQSIDQGLDGLVFLGHAYLSGWSTPPLLTSQGAGALSNRHLFLSFSFSCFDGAFTGPWTEALSSALMNNPAGGALAALAFSSLTSPQALQIISELLLCALLSGQAQNVGQAWLLVQQKLAGLDRALDEALATLNLLGHPLLANPWRR